VYDCVCLYETNGCVHANVVNYLNVCICLYDTSECEHANDVNDLNLCRFVCVFVCMKRANMNMRIELFESLYVCVFICLYEECEECMWEVWIYFY